MSTEPWFPPTGVLKPSLHSSLILKRETIAADANIPVDLLWKRLPELTQGEKAWLGMFKQHRAEGYCGLLLTGQDPVIDPLGRVGAMAGFLNRHFIRARVFALADVLAFEEEGQGITATCLLIPDFVPDKKVGKELPGWRIQQLSAMLTHRWSQSKLQTVLYAPSLDRIQAEYGASVASLVKNHYIEVAVNLGAPSSSSPLKLS